MEQEWKDGPMLQLGVHIFSKLVCCCFTFLIGLDVHLQQIRNLVLHIKHSSYKVNNTTCHIAYSDVVYPFTSLVITSNIFPIKAVGHKRYIFYLTYE
jgi:hypothetical protein